MSLKRWDGSSWVVVAGSRPGPQGPQGATGPAGQNATISIGTVDTTSSGTNATVTNSGTATAAILNFQIPRGATGQQGVQGIQGVAGVRGSLHYTGVNAPTSLNPAPSGLLGNDTYLATSTGNWYTYDASGSGAWSLSGNIKGATGQQGVQGVQGVAGVRGSLHYTGVNAPTSLNPAPSGLLGNDTYLATSTGNWYVYDASGQGSWSLGGNIKGPTGSQGPKGDTGATGPSGSVLANELYAKTAAWEVDALCNLGIYWPVHTSSLTQTQLNSRFAASSFLF